jgi:hypothetical protein
MNLFSGLKGRHAMNLCAKCGGMLQTVDPRKVEDGRVYHPNCWWQVEQEAVRNIAPPLLGVDYVPKTIVGNGDPT